jgi:hypothetical protein
MDAPAAVGHAAAVRLAVALVLAAACQTGTSSSPAAGSGRPPASTVGQPKTGPAAPGAAIVAMLTKGEAEELCNAYERSGAATDSPDNRDYLVANYLAKTVKSETGHAWLINFARLGADKAARVDALTRAAKDAGLTSCPLVAMWQ